MKPWLLMHQLGIPFDLHVIDVLNGEQKSQEFLTINPLGLVPYLITPDGHGLGESAAMLWHLAEGTDLMPPTRNARAEALQWMFFEQSRLEPFISPARFFTTILPDMATERADDIAQWLMSATSGLARLEAHLSCRTYMLNTGYSIADIQVFGYVHVLNEAGLSLSDYPGIAAWIDRVCATDRFQPLSLLGQKPKTCAA